MDLDTRLRVPESVLMRKVGDDMVMLHLGKETYYGLNDVGAVLMQQAEAGATLRDVAQRLVEEFDVDAAQAEADLRRVASELLAAGLIEEDRAP